MGYVIGIDLGTTYTAAAVGRNDRVEMINLGSTSAAVPSVVHLSSDGSISVGDAALRRVLTDPDRIARSFKRRIGDPAPLTVGGIPIAAHLISARLLRWVLDLVAEREGGAPDAIAVTHPANWGAYKREFLTQLLQAADVGDAMVLTEPEGAAIGYAASARVNPGEIIAVYDLGGGTFDAAVLQRSGTGFQLLGTPQGVEQLGGLDFDEAVFQFVADSLDGALDDLDPEDSMTTTAVARLRDECVAAKIALSSDPEAVIPVMLPGRQQAVRITREDFEDVIRPLLTDTMSAMRRSLRSAGVEPEELARVLLVGGSSRVPLVAQLVTNELGRPVAVDADPKNLIAKGAAHHAGGTLDDVGEQAEPSAAAPPPAPTPTAPAAPPKPAPIVTQVGGVAAPPPTAPGPPAAPPTPPAAPPTPGAPAEPVGGPPSKPPKPPKAPKPPKDGEGGSKLSPKVLIGGGVGLLVLLIVGFLVLGGGGGGDDGDGGGDSDSGGTPSLQTISVPSSLELGEEIDIEPSAVTPLITDEFVYLPVNGERVSVLDLETLEEVASVPVEGGGGRTPIVVGSEIWVPNGFSAITVIDPETNRAKTQFEVVGSLEEAVVIDDDVWFVTSSGDIQIVTAAHVVEELIPVAQSSPAPPTFSGGKFFVASTIEPSMSVIDIATKTEIDTVRFDNPATAAKQIAAVSDDQIWALTSDSVLQFDVETLAQVDTISATGNLMYVTSDSVFIFAFDELRILDLDGVDKFLVDVPGNPIFGAGGDGAVVHITEVSGENDQLVVFDGIDGTEVARIELGTGALSTVVHNDVVYVVDNEEALLREISFVFE